MRYTITARTTTDTTGELDLELPTILGSASDDAFDRIVYEKAKSGELAPEGGVFPNVLQANVKVLSVFRGDKRIFPREKKPSKSTLQRIAAQKETLDK